MGLDLELDDDVARRGREQILDEQRRLRRQPAHAVSQPCAPKLARRALMREALEVGTQRQVRIVQQDERAVSSQAHVALETVDAGRERTAQRRGRGVRPVRAPQPMRVKRRQHAPHCTPLAHAPCQQAVTTTLRARERSCSPTPGSRVWRSWPCGQHSRPESGGYADPANATRQPTLRRTGATAGPVSYSCPRWHCTSCAMSHSQGKPGTRLWRRPLWRRLVTGMTRRADRLGGHKRSRGGVKPSVPSSRRIPHARCPGRLPGCERVLGCATHARLGRRAGVGSGAELTFALRGEGACGSTRARTSSRPHLAVVACHARRRERWRRTAAARRPLW